MREQISAIYDALNRRDLDGALALLPEEMEWDLSRRPTLPAGVSHGREGGRAALEALLATWSELRFEPLEFRDVGDRIVVPLRITARGNRSGIALEEPVTHAWVVRDGRIAAFEYHPAS